MKTPHRITLIRGENIQGRYNPVTDTYETGITNRQTVPCFVTETRNAKVFEEYGDRNLKLITCRFMQPQAPFASAEFNGKTYTPLETLTGLIKGSIRLKEGG